MLDLKGLAAATAILSVAMGWAVAFSGRAPAPVTEQAAAPRSASLPPAKPVAMVKVLVAEPRRGAARPRVVARAVSHATLPPGTVAAAPLPPQTVAPDPAVLAQEAGRVATHISARLPPPLTPYFDTFVYVSKAASGPWAQRLFLFHKNADGTLALEESFAISTGRERAEQYFTATPTGFFELDVHRFFPMARSAKWNDAQMPWAMFLNYSYRTKMAGVALHAAIGRHELADIGHRASGGCVRLPIEKASAFYHRFLAEERGQVPVFTFDTARGTTNTAGLAAHDAAGNIVLADGLRVLVMIDNFAGLPGDPTQS
ncbi:MAG: L,D-transpeptidase family protein [Rhizomicrobium sp.]